MLHIYLSDQARRDLMHYASIAPHCLNALEEALVRFNSVEDLRRATLIPTRHEIKRLKCKPTAWRLHDGECRTVFTASKVWATDSIQVLRIAHRSKVYRGLERYLNIDIQDVYLWNAPNANEDDLLDNDWSSKQQADRRYQADQKYQERSRLQVHQLRGSAGSGKTTVALQLSINAVEQGAYPILIVPNRAMQQYSYQFIQQERPQLRICQSLSSDTESKPSDLALFTKDYLLQKLAGDKAPAISSAEANYLIYKAIANQRISIPPALEALNLYALYLGIATENDTYQDADRDPLLQQLNANGAIDFIRDPRNSHFIKQALQERDVLSQVERIQKKWEGGKWSIFREIMAQMTVSSNELDQPTDVSDDNTDRSSTKHPILIIDEVQDFYWGQINAIFRFFTTQFPMDESPSFLTTCCLGNELKISWDAVSEHRGRLIILAGDNNQRVTFSGFSWAGFATTFRKYYPNSDLLPPPEAFKRNYRNTAAIARVANYFLSSQRTALRAFENENNNANWIDAPPDPENCECQVGKHPFLINVDDTWLKQLVSCLRQKLESLEERERFIFIDHKVDENHKSLWSSLGVSHLSEEAENQKLYWASIAEAKGREFRAVTLVYPFARCSDRPAVSELFNWYTSLTRAKEYLAILVSAQEMDWLLNTVRSFSELEGICRIENQSITPEAFATELFAEGRDKVSSEQEIEELLDRAFQSIQLWLAGTRRRPDYLLAPFEERNQSVWEILSNVERRGLTLQEQISVDVEDLQLLTLEDSPPLNALLIYIAILPYLLNSSFEQRIDRQMIALLERYVTQSTDEDLQEFFYFELNESLLGRCVLYRAREESWKAAETLVNYPDNQISQFLYQQISRDLERRDLPWEAARLRHHYLDTPIDLELPFYELMARSGYLTTNLIEEIQNQVSQLTKEMQRLD